MKTAVISLASAIIASVSLADGANITLGSMTLEGAENAVDNIAVGNYTMSSASGDRSNIAVGGGAMSKTEKSNRNIAIGSGAMSASSMTHGNVAIGEGEMAGENYIRDTTSINGKQLWISEQAKAFSICPVKNAGFTNSPIYYKNGELHFNATNLVTHGNAKGFNELNVGTIIPRHDDDPYEAYAVKKTEWLIDGADFTGAATNIVYEKDRYMWHTGTAVRVEYMADCESGKIDSAKVKLHMQWRFLYDQWTDMRYEADIEVPVKTAGKHFARTVTNIVVWAENPLEDPLDEHMTAFVRYDDSISSEYTDRIAVQFTTYDRYGRTLAAPMITVGVKDFEDLIAERSKVETKVDIAVDAEHDRSLVTGKAVAEYAEKRFAVGGMNFDGDFAVRKDLNAMLSGTNVVQNIWFMVPAESAKEIVNSTKPFADGGYPMLDFKYNVDGVFRWEERGVRWAQRDWGVGSWHTPTQPVSDILYMGDEDLYEFTAWLETSTEDGKANVTVSWKVEKNFAIELASGEVTYRDLRFYPKAGASYSADAVYDRGCPASTRLVYDDTLPLRVCDIKPTAREIGDVQCMREQWRYGNIYGLRIESRHTDIADTFSKDGIFHPDVVYVCFSNMVGRYSTWYEESEVALTNGTTRTGSFNFAVSSTLYSGTYTFKYDTDPAKVTLTFKTISSGNEYTYEYTDDADYYEKNAGKGVMDSSISRDCVSSTKYVDDRLGGATFRFENGGFAVYTNGVKAGTLTFTPSP